MNQSAHFPARPSRHVERADARAQATRVDVSGFPDRCELLAKLRDRKPRREYLTASLAVPPRRRAKALYWHAPIRLCRGLAVALVKFTDRGETMRTCAGCFDRELRERPDQLEWFEIVRLSRGHRRRLEAAIDSARRQGKERAPQERSGAPPGVTTSLE